LGKRPLKYGVPGVIEASSTRNANPRGDGDLVANRWRALDSLHFRRFVIRPSLALFHEMRRLFTASEPLQLPFLFLIAHVLGQVLLSGPYKPSGAQTDSRKTRRSRGG